MAGGAQGIRAGRAFIELGTQDKFSAGLKRAQQQLAAFGAGLQSIGLRMAAIGSAAIAPFIASVKTFSSVGDQLDKMSRRTGVSVEALSELGFAAELSGADMETLETGLRKMQRTITDAAAGSQAADEALGDLGLSAAAVAAMSPEQQFKLIADRLSGIADPTRRAALAMEIFGRSGTRLLPLLEDGAAGINRMQREARALGLTMSSQTARQAALLNDTLHTTWRVIKQVSVAVGAALALDVIDLSNAVTSVVVNITNWIKQNRELVVRAAQIAAAVIAGGAALIGFGVAASAAAMAIGGIAKALAVVKGTIVVVTGLLGAMLSPIGLLIAGVTALGAALVTSSQAGGSALHGLGERFGELLGTVKGVVGGIVDALVAGDIALAADVLWKSLQLAWAKGTLALKQIWLDFKRFFLTSMSELWFALAVQTEKAVHAVTTAFLSIQTSLRSVWANFTSDLLALMSQTVDSALSGFTKFMHIIGAHDDETQAILEETAQRQRESDAVAIERRRNEKLAEADKVRAAALQAEVQRHREAVQRLEAEHQRRVEAAGELDTTELKQLKEALNAARKALDDSIAKARKERQALTAKPAPRSRLSFPLDDLEDRLSRIGEVIQQKLSVAGTFSGHAVGGLGVGAATMRIVVATEQTARNTKRIADAGRSAQFA